MNIPEKSWREELAQRMEDLCGLNPKALGVGGGINRDASPLWRTRKYEEKPE
jgi:hypothetical protein